MRSMPAVLFDSSQTNGSAIFDSRLIGRATILATRSEELMPIRLGTSSPRISVR